MSPFRGTPRVRARALHKRRSRHNLGMATGTSLSHVFPLGSRLNERGRVEVGGCDTIELAREFGTPAYVVAEEDLRARARAFAQAGSAAGHEDFHVVFASKAFPCTAVLSLFAEEGLWCDVASGGELHLALNAGFPPERIVMHGNAKSEAELSMALEAAIGSDRDRQLRRDRSARASCSPTARSRPPWPAGARARDTRRRGETHEKISTGQADSKFGFSMADVAARSSACGRSRGSSCAAFTRTSARSCWSWSPSVARSKRSRRSATGRAGSPSTISAAALASHTLRAAAARRSRSTCGGARAAHEAGIDRAARVDRAGTRATANAACHALHSRERQAERLDAGWRSTAACLTTCARCSTAPPTKRTWPIASPACERRVRAGRQALRVRRCDRARRRCSRTQGPET